MGMKKIAAAMIFMAAWGLMGSAPALAQNASSGSLPGTNMAGGAAAGLPGAETNHHGGSGGGQDGNAKIYPVWRAGTAYLVGDVVSHEGYLYRALRESSGGEEPDDKKFWKKLRKDNTPVNGIYYHGGEVMSAPLGVYYIWYGNWTPHAKTQAILRHFMRNLGDSPAWAVNTTYYDRTGAHVSPHVFLAHEIADRYSQGPALTPESTLAIIKNAIGAGRLPARSDAAYILLTSPDVKHDSPFGSFGSMYCTLHNTTSYAGTKLRYIFVGNPAIQAPGCGVNNPSPNGDSAGDAMVNMVFHALSSMSSDPDLTTWYDDTGPDPDHDHGNGKMHVMCSAEGLESGDKCLWNYGPTQRDARNAEYNHTIGGANYLLQQVWINSHGGMCVQRPSDARGPGTSH